MLQSVRFVGGGCPGNATLVSRLLAGRPIEEALEYLKGIPCRNDTSCPDQLALAIQAVERGELQPAESFRLHREPSAARRIALIGRVEGSADTLGAILSMIQEARVDKPIWDSNRESGSS